MRWVLSEPCGLERLCTGGRAGNVWVKDHLDPDQENYASQGRRGLATAIRNQGSPPLQKPFERATMIQMQERMASAKTGA
jgi:hypothetical protein